MAKEEAEEEAEECLGVGGGSGVGVFEVWSLSPPCVSFVSLARGWVYIIYITRAKVLISLRAHVYHISYRHIAGSRCSFRVPCLDPCLMLDPRSSIPDPRSSILDPHTHAHNPPKLQPH